MITYETLKELAQSLSKVTGYRYVAFRKSFFGDLVVCFSDCKMLWHETKDDPFGIWLCILHRVILPIQGFRNLDRFQCQFDCKEAE